MPLRQSTICILVKNQQILLAMKKRGFGAGKWNGYGGKAQPEEDIKDAAVRELTEESGLKVKSQDLNLAARINFIYNNKPEWDQDISIFLIKNWEGEAVETEEMKPQWYSFEQIPYDEMWVDDRLWLPRVLAGQKLTGSIYFNADGSLVEKIELKNF